ncbi:hypothetical protein BGX24_000753 [Mortierella sp. AD032]|nr:hypothetical protein BGX24_000753 [Mortierella sp. AD032]
MTIQDTLPHVQAVRCVYDNGHSTTSPNTAEVFHLPCHLDPSLNKDILLWDDIVSAFKGDIIHIRSGTIILPYLKGTDFKNLDPLRIAAVPDVTLDVVFRGRTEDKELSLESLQKALPGAHQQGDVNNPAFNAAAIATVKRNPVGGLVETAWENYMYIDETPPTVPNRITPTDWPNLVGGLVEVAMDTYRNNDNPAFGPRLRGPQAVIDNALPSTASDSLPTPQKLIYSLQTVASQESGPDTIKDFDGTTEKARCGDKETQFVL